MTKQNSTEHTPGPWHVDCVISEALHDICMSNPPPEEGNPVLLASIYYEDNGRRPTLKESTANARLMAAAPDLLAACKQALSQLVSIGNALGEYWENARSLSDVDAIKALEAAINKAEGRA